ncbi:MULTISPECIES: flavocytochrome c [unclassified Halanaerobium]|uniref:flavocytochrome c n=1 Tax=unclassified Halanaerobium TaxID=2641197 RepID=UPI000DF3E654|nr:MULTISPECIES: flavocytochrome c [unclassified Halanaerobium]RCW47343.1 fumarate reductase flavoprotein subunit [Halanaerobium sp. MA284_MarDTE_T2]RCW84882.1 fumarate reductase flavoprotein subunit [Halanaerobium sp. DL-01]
MRLKSKTAVLFLVLLLIVSAAGSVLAEESYTGEAEGHNGNLKLEVIIENQEIKEINVLESKESNFTDPAFDQVISDIIASNSIDVDTVSGATVTSKAIISAVEDAVSKAGITLTAKTAVKKETNSDTSTDIVVIGGGGAGLSAAIEASSRGVDVILVEKMPILGGNTAYATGGLNAAETEFQKANGIEDDADLFFEDTMLGGKLKNNALLVNKLTETADETVAWLTKLGVDLSDVGRLGGASVSRAHRPAGGAAVGSHLVDVLVKNAKKAGVDIRLSTKAVEILHNGNAVNGITVENKNGRYNINAEAVIVATGGFGANPEKVVKFDPSLKGFGTTNAPGATGDALDFLAPLNVALVDMKEIQTHPTVVPVKNKMITEAVRGNGAILVNRDAVRFVDELETRDIVSAAELDQEGQTAFLIFDQGVRESLSAIESYYKAGLLTEAESLTALAEKMNLDADQLKSTVNRYNGFVKSGNDKDFGRENMKSELTKAPYYAVEVGPAVHHTMGGVKINLSTEVINKSGEVIEGLYAAGEVTGGIHGANRLGGNALADITTFGKTAGAKAAEFVK